MNQKIEEFYVSKAKKYTFVFSKPVNYGDVIDACADKLEEYETIYDVLNYSQDSETKVSIVVHHEGDDTLICSKDFRGYVIGSSDGIYLDKNTIDTMNYFNGSEEFKYDDLFSISDIIHNEQKDTIMYYIKAYVLSYEDTIIKMN